MAYRLPAYLHRNRHGILYFRLTVPPDLRPVVGQAEIYRSLDTANVQRAADTAQTLQIEFRAIFRQLRHQRVCQEKQKGRPEAPSCCHLVHSGVVVGICFV